MTDDSLNELLKTLYVVSPIALLILIIASSFGFFKVAIDEVDFREVSFFKLLFSFALYFGTAAILVPSIIVLFTALFTLKIPQYPQDILRIIPEEMLNVISYCIATLFLILLTIAPKMHVATIIWNKEKKGFLELLKDMLFGALSYVVAYPFVMVVSYASVIIFVFLWHHPPGKEEQVVVRLLTSFSDHPELFYLISAIIVFIVPIGEEILFRGFFQNWAKNWFPAYGSILLTSVLFALFHFAPSQGFANIQLMSALFTLSCFLGLIYERQKTLIAPIALHSTFNAVSIFTLILKWSEN